MSTAKWCLSKLSFWSFFWWQMPTISWTMSNNIAYNSLPNLCYKSRSTTPWIPFTSWVVAYIIFPTIFICICFIVFHFLNSYILTLWVLVVHLKNEHLQSSIMTWSRALSLAIEMLAQLICFYHPLLCILFTYSKIVCKHWCWFFYLSWTSNLYNFPFW